MVILLDWCPSEKGCMEQYIEVCRPSGRSEEVCVSKIITLYDYAGSTS